MSDDRVVALEAENERLRERIQVLEEQLMCETLPPIEWGLTGCEARIFGTLMKLPHANKVQLLSAVTLPTGDEPEIKIVDVFICKLRKKLRPHDIIIDTIWGFGYSIKPEVKVLARQQMAQA